jgi:hypothetical protein
MSRQSKFSALLQADKTPSSPDGIPVDESSTTPASEPEISTPAKVTKPRRRPSPRPAPEVTQPDPETAITGKRAQGKRARGQVNLGILLSAGLRDDLRVAVSLDPERRDLSELCADLISDYLDTLSDGYQNIRPSRRSNIQTPKRTKKAM